MSSRSMGAAVVGGLLAGFGGLLLMAGVLRHPLVDHPIAGLPGTLVAMAGGLLGVLTGILMVMWPRHEAGPVPSVPAHVAFTQKAVPRPTTPPVAAPRPAAVAPQKAMVPVVPRGRDREPSLAQLDQEIKELTLKINKAGVLLATGQLSTQGYQHYVQDLKKERGKLEATRVKAELHKQP